MNGMHDLGGMHGFGAVEVEEHEPVFHADWERRVFAFDFLAGSADLYTSPEFRSAIERMAPVDYLGTSYYEHWLVAIEQALLDKGVASREELDARTRAFAGDPKAAVPRREDAALTGRMLRGIRRGVPLRRAVSASPRFAVGDRVLTRNDHPVGHTRLPRYARGKHGVIQRLHGAFDLPDALADGRGELPEHCYGVRLDAAELWGDSAEAADAVYLDPWESYLEPA